METIFIPVLAIPSGVMNIDFYRNAFNATERWRITNGGGSIHVASFSIDGAEFRLHEESPTNPSPVNTTTKQTSNTTTTQTGNTTTVTIVLTTSDVHAVFNQALAAGATAAKPVTDFEYGYRQGVLEDPFGHLWQIEQLLSKETFDRFVNNINKPSA